MTNEADALMVTTIVEALMDYSRQLIMDEHTDGQDYGSAAVIDGITFMKEFEVKRSELAAEVERLEARNEEAERVIRGLLVLVVEDEYATDTAVYKAGRAFLGLEAALASAGKRGEGSDD